MYRWQLNSGEIVRTNMKQLCGFAVSHIVTHYYAASHRVAWSVCRSFCRSVSLSHYWVLQKMAEMIKLPFSILYSGRPNEWTVYYMRSRCQHGKGQFWGGNRQTIVNYRNTPWSSVQRWLNGSRCRLGCGLAWVKSITCYMGGPDPPWGGAILVDRGTHYKV